MDRAIGLRNCRITEATFPDLTFSESLRDRLPLELRTLIYTFIFDPETLQETHACAFSQREGTIVPFLLPSRIDETIRLELISHFCTSTPYAMARNSSELSSLFTRTLFSSNLHLSPSKLSVLVIHRTLHGWFNPTSPTQTSLRRALGPILHCFPELSNKFALTIYIHTNLYLPRWRNSDGGVSRPIREKFLKMFAQLRKMWPSFCSVKRSIEEAGTSRKVVFVLRLKRYRGVDLLFEVKDEKGEWDEEKWFKYALSCDSNLHKATEGFHRPGCAATPNIRR